MYQVAVKIGRGSTSFLLEREAGGWGVPLILCCTLNHAAGVCYNRHPSYAVHPLTNSRLPSFHLRIYLCCPELKKTRIILSFTLRQRYTRRPGKTSPTYFNPLDFSKRATLPTRRRCSFWRLACECHAWMYVVGRLRYLCACTYVLG